MITICLSKLNTIQQQNFNVDNTNSIKEGLCSRINWISNLASSVPALVWMGDSVHAWGYGKRRLLHVQDTLLGLEKGKTDWRQLPFQTVQSSWRNCNEKWSSKCSWWALQWLFEQLANSVLAEKRKTYGICNPQEPTGQLQRCPLKEPCSSINKLWPSSDDVERALSIKEYDNPPFNRRAAKSFRNQLEGFMLLSNDKFQTCQDLSHARTHTGAYEGPASRGSHLSRRGLGERLPHSLHGTHDRRKWLRCQHRTH